VRYIQYLVKVAKDEKKDSQKPTEKEKKEESSKPKFKPYPHQKALLEKALKLHEQHGKIRLIVAHTMGTGKTYTATMLMHELKKKSPEGKLLVVSPSSIRTHFKEHVDMLTDMKSHILEKPHQIGTHPADVHIVSYDFFRNNIEKFLQHKDKYKGLIVDEAHNLRNPMSKISQSVRAFSDLNDDAHVIFLTGSITNNRPEELGVLLRNLLGKQFHYGDNYKLFAAHFLKLARSKKIKEIKKEAPSRAHLARKYWDKLNELPPKYEIKPESAHVIESILKKHVDYIGMEHLDKLPKVISENVDIEMSPLQEEIFKNVANTTFKEFNEARLSGKPLSPILQKGFMVAALKVRMLSNDPRVAHHDFDLDKALEHSPKIKKIAEDTKHILEEHPENAVVIYTNFVKHGAEIVSHALNKHGIDHYVFHGGLSKEERKKMVDDFKKYKKRVIIITPAGNEGVSLNNGSHLLMVDPHPNPEKQKQAETRIRRLNSLHPKVVIRRYFAVPKTKEAKKLHYAFGADWSIMGLAFEKSWKNKTIYDLLNRVAKNQSLNKKEEMRKAAFELEDFVVGALSGKAMFFDIYEGTLTLQ